ncbi:MAG: hypothetical protein ABEH64_10665 [Salinirussus sp.]
MRTIVGYRRTIVALDLLGIGCIPAVIAAIHFLVPVGLQEQFIFRQSLNRPETFLTAAYLHLTDQHLFGNLLGYALAAVYTYVLCLYAGERQWFWLTTLAFLTLLPVAVNLTSMAIWQTAYAGVNIPASRGLSGVVAGYGGFLVVALLVLLRKEYQGWAVSYVGQFVLLVVLGELLVIYADSPPIIGGALLLLAIGLVGVGMVVDVYPDGLPEDREGWLSILLAGLLVILVVVVVSVLVYGLFPVQLVEDGSLTNIFAHMSGLVWGAVIAGWGYRYWGK